MHPIHSDLMAHVVTEDRRRAVIARHVPIDTSDDPAGDQHREPSAAGSLLSWFRGSARLEARHHA